MMREFLVVAEDVSHSEHYSNLRTLSAGWRACSAGPTGFVAASYHPVSLQSCSYKLLQWMILWRILPMREHVCMMIRQVFDQIDAPVTKC